MYDCIEKRLHMRVEHAIWKEKWKRGWNIQIINIRIIKWRIQRGMNSEECEREMERRENFCLDRERDERMRHFLVLSLSQKADRMLRKRKYEMSSWLISQQEMKLWSVTMLSILGLRCQRINTRLGAKKNRLLAWTKNESQRFQYL